MNAQHRINKRDARLRRINRQIEWWTNRTSQAVNEQESGVGGKILEALKRLKQRYEQVET